MVVENLLEYRLD